MPEIQSLLTGRPVLALDESSTAMDAARQMKGQQVGAVLVTDGAGQPRGIFTERDLMVRVIVAGLDPQRVRLGEVMTRELYLSPPDRKVADVRRDLQDRHIRHVPVVRDGQVIGMLSLRDLLRADLERASSELSETRRYILGESSDSPPPA